MQKVVHVIGAGLSGLSAAVRLAEQGQHVCLYEASNAAGGRCRSYFDQALNRRIDNGNHLVLSGNLSVARFLATIGSSESLWSPDRAEFPFVDLQSGLKWTVRPDCGRIPWSLLKKSNRVPGSSLGDYLQGLRLIVAGAGQTVRDCLDADRQLYRRFWEPMAVSVLNTDPAEASARLLAPVLRETFWRGESACRPLVVKQGLSESFVDPALSYLQSRKCELTFGARVMALESTANKITGLRLGDRRIGVSAGDSVILAVPPLAALALVPGLTVPDAFRAIVNGHFLLPGTGSPEMPFIGLVGGVGHWLFVRNGVASVTVSAAEHLVGMRSEEIARILWPEIVRVLEIPDTRSVISRIVKEKRATFAQTPAQVRRRPPAVTESRNLYLAGDWTDTGLPATIEGSLASGERAARYILNAV